MWSTTQRAGSSDDNPEGKPPQIASWHAHQGSVVSVEYLSRDQGALLLSASEDCTARLWTRDGQYIGMFGQVSKGQFFLYLCRWCPFASQNAYSDWFSPGSLSRNWRVVPWVLNFRFPITTVCSWTAVTWTSCLRAHHCTIIVVVVVVSPPFAYL